MTRPADLLTIRLTTQLKRLILSYTVAGGRILINLFHFPRISDVGLLLQEWVLTCILSRVLGVWVEVSIVNYGRMSFQFLGLEKRYRKELKGAFCILFFHFSFRLEMKIPNCLGHILEFSTYPLANTLNLPPYSSLFFGERFGSLKKFIWKQWITTLLYYKIPQCSPISFVYHGFSLQFDESP